MSIVKVKRTSSSTTYLVIHVYSLIYVLLRYCLRQIHSTLDDWCSSNFRKRIYRSYRTGLRSRLSIFSKLALQKIIPNDKLEFIAGYFSIQKFIEVSIMSYSLLSRAVKVSADLNLSDKSQMFSETNSINVPTWM